MSHIVAEIMKRLLGILILLYSWVPAFAAPMTYIIDSHHTYPSFEADHMGISTWRGKFKESSGTVTLDREMQAGSIDILIDVASIDFGHNLMNSVARSAQMFDVDRFPQAQYTGTLEDFVDGMPTKAHGLFTLRGITHPLVLVIDRFKCIHHPFVKREVCGANAIGKFNREQFGIDIGKSMGFGMEVGLAIQVEAILQE